MLLHPGLPRQSLVQRNVIGFRFAALLLLATLPQSVHAEWHLVESANFRVWARTSLVAECVSQACETQRAELRDFWQGETPQSLWSPARWTTRCDVVVHPTQAEYMAAVGRGGARSYGSSYWRVQAGQIVCRRIDLRSDDRDPCVAALPHELTHLVLADRFLEQTLPRWADEGVAVLADPLVKQQGHERDWQTARVAKTCFRAAELIALEQYPTPERVAIFYGQSAAMVRNLLRHAPPPVFLDFIDSMQKHGIDNALRKHFNFSDLAGWERAVFQSESQLLDQEQHLATFMPVSINRGQSTLK